MSQSSFIRHRRLRTNPTIRKLVEETALQPSNFVQPLFVKFGDRPKVAISSMPGQFQLSIKDAVEEAKVIYDLGIPAVILFGIPAHKDSEGSDNFNEDGIIPQAIHAIKSAVPELLVMSDMCFCEYTDHGHCGIINDPKSAKYHSNLPEGYLLNDETLENLARASIVHAQAGADIIAPSGNIDGMVATIREGLDTKGFENTIILSYAVKYASSFYGPFREAAEGAPSFGDRSQYQMNPANSDEAIREALEDLAQGADMLMVKPALPYLDIISRLKHEINAPIAAYNVSGEYAMLHAAAQNNWLDLRKTALETLIAIRRAGAQIIVTYFAKDAVGWL